jgi:hypothetical protein
MNAILLSYIMTNYSVRRRVEISPTACFDSRGPQCPLSTLSYVMLRLFPLELVIRPDVLGEFHRFKMLDIYKHERGLWAMPKKLHARI